MTPKEAIDIIRYTFLNVDNHLNDGGTERSSQDIHDALVLACSALCNHSLPSNLDEAAEFDKMFEDFCDQHPDGLTLNECAEFFYDKGKQAGAEWMAGQGQTLDSLIWRDEDDKLFIEAFVDENKFKMAENIIIQIRKKQ